MCIPASLSLVGNPCHIAHTGLYQYWPSGPGCSARVTRAESSSEDKMGGPTMFRKLHLTVLFLLTSTLIAFGVVVPASAGCNPTPFTPSQAFVHTYNAFPGIKFDVQPSTMTLTANASGQIELGTAKILIEFDGTQN